MIADRIENWRATPLFAAHPVWREAFEWIEKRAGTAEDGDYSLEESGCLVHVMSYGLKTREEARWESHRRLIDLQFTIEGAEAIDWEPVESLQPACEYDEENDFEFYAGPERGAGRIDNRRGHFCVFFPGDGHRPQLELPGHDRVRKLVVKIPLEAVTGS